MHGTKVDRDRRRAERWIARTGGMASVPEAALDLLARRLAARYRVLLRWTPLLLLPIGVTGVVVVRGFGTAGSRAEVRWVLAAYALVAVLMVLISDRISRAERGIGRTLPHRVTRGTAVDVRTMLGWARTTCLAATLTAEAGLAVVLLWAGTGWLLWTYLAAFTVACGLVAVGVKQSATRATIAVDLFSLTIDERMRSEDAFAATGPLYIWMFAFPFETVAGADRAWLVLLWGGVFMGVSLLRAWGAARRPWRSMMPAGWWSPTAPAPGGDHP
jgi:hypothetical protein